MTVFCTRNCTESSKLTKSNPICRHHNPCKSNRYVDLWGSTPSSGTSDSVHQQWPTERPNLPSAFTLDGHSGSSWRDRVAAVET